MQFKDILLIATSVVTVASIIVKITPTKKDDEFLGKVQKFLKMISLNKDS